MKTGALLRVICFYAVAIIDIAYAGQMDIAKITSNDLSKERFLFKKCWHSIYQDYSLQQLGFSNVSRILQESFDQEERDYKAQVPNRLFFNATLYGQVVGYVSFEIKNEQAVYIKQIALLPEVCTVDALRELIFVIFDHIDNVSCLHMTLHRVALRYEEIGHELGFVALPGADKALFIHLRMQFNKCGACLCDLDYADDDDEMYSDPFLDDENYPESDDSWAEFDEEDSENRGCIKGDKGDFCTYSEKE